MTGRLRSVDIRPPGGRRLAAGLLLVATPKCLLCLAAYAGLGTALGLGGPELCGAAPGSAGSVIPAADLTAAAIVVIATGMLLRRR